MTRLLPPSVSPAPRPDSPPEPGRADLRPLGDTTAAFDLAPLRRLRALAGEAAAAELFARLNEDLAAARLGLRRAAALGDLGALRAHSHVAIALAGTAGAMALHADAVALNELANADMAADRLPALTLALDHGLAQLAQAVRREAQSPPPAADNPTQNI